MDRNAKGGWHPDPIAALPPSIACGEVQRSRAPPHRETRAVDMAPPRSLMEENGANRCLRTGLPGRARRRSVSRTASRAVFSRGSLLATFILCPHPPSRNLRRCNRVASTATARSSCSRQTRRLMKRRTPQPRLSFQPFRLSRIASPLLASRLRRTSMHFAKPREAPVHAR